MRSGEARGRRIAARVVAGLLALLWGLFFFGLIDFLTVLVQDEEFARHYIMESGWGLMFLVLVTVPLLVLVVRPGTTDALLQVLACGLALAVGALLAASAAQLLLAAGVAASALVLAALAPTRLRLSLHRPAPLTGLLTVLAVVPAAPYAWHMARDTADTDYTNGLDHYPVQGAFAVAVVLLTGLAAMLTAQHARSRWLPALTVAFSAGWLGVESMVYPHLLGSFGTTWGALAAVWSAALLAAVAVEGRAANAAVSGSRAVLRRP